MKKVLITGITGMIGTHLALTLRKEGLEIAGLSRPTSASRYTTEKSFYAHYRGDILDKTFLKNVWRDWQPDLVYHLAAQAYNSESWRAEDTTYLMNIQGTRNVLEACRDFSPHARFIPACSSTAYGLVPEHLIPIEEDRTPLQPITPYGISKAVTEMMSRQFHLNYAMDVVLPRLFVHIGPGHPPLTAVQNFACQLAAIKIGLQAPVLRVGNLSGSRDFVDVRDGARALWMLARKGKSGEVYNLCTGKAWTIRQTLDMLIEASGLVVSIKTDPELFRPSDEKLLLGNPGKLNELGWKAETPFQKTLADIYSDWENRLKKTSPGRP